MVDLMKLGAKQALDSLDTVYQLLNDALAENTHSARKEEAKIKYIEDKLLELNQALERAKKWIRAIEEV